MSRKIRIISLAICTAILLIFFTACTRQGEVQPMLDIEKFDYANGLFFDFRIVIGDNVWDAAQTVQLRILPTSPLFDPFYTDFVLVQNQEQASELPDYVIAAWPRAGGGEAAIEAIHWVLENPSRWSSGNLRFQNATLEEVGLSYPITVADLVDSWEKVNALLQSFSSASRSAIWNAALHGSFSVPLANSCAGVG